MSILPRDWELLQRALGLLSLVSEINFSFKCSTFLKAIAKDAEII